MNNNKDLPGVPDSRTTTMSVARFEDAVKNPEDFELSLSFLGWSLSYLGEECATCISIEQAHELIYMFSRARATRFKQPSVYDGLSQTQKDEAHTIQVQQMIRSGA